MADATKETPRRKQVPLKVYCLEVERDAIERNADQAGLSVSHYLRNVGAGYSVSSCLDQRAIKDMARVNADLGRVGGLLKALLSSDERFDGLVGIQLQQRTLVTVSEILETQRLLRRVVEGITGK